MKNSIKASILIAALALCVTAQAQFQNNFPNFGTLNGNTTNAIQVLTTGTTNFPTEIPIGTTGISIMPYFSSTNASTAAVGVNVYVCEDGTNYSTLPVTSQSVAMNGTAGVRGFVFCPPTSVQNVAKVKIGITNAHTATLFLTNVVYSFWR